MPPDGYAGARAKPLTVMTSARQVLSYSGGMPTAATVRASLNGGFHQLVRATMCRLARSPRLRHRQRHAHREDDHQRRAPARRQNEHGLTACRAPRHGADALASPWPSSTDGHARPRESATSRGPRRHRNAPTMNGHMGGTRLEGPKAADDAHERNRRIPRSGAPPGAPETRLAPSAHKGRLSREPAAGSHIGGGGRRQRQQFFPGADAPRTSRQQRIRRRHDTPAHRSQATRSAHPSRNYREDGRQRGESVSQSVSKQRQSAGPRQRPHRRSVSHPGPEARVWEDRPGESNSETSGKTAAGSEAWPDASFAVTGYHPPGAPDRAATAIRARRPSSDADADAASG